MTVTEIKEYIDELVKEVNELRKKRMIKDIEIIKDIDNITAIVTFYEYQSKK